MNIGDLVRLVGPLELAGMTGRCERIGPTDIDVRLTSTGRLVVIPRSWAQCTDGQPITVETTMRERLVSR